MNFPMGNGFFRWGLAVLTLAGGVWVSAQQINNRVSFHDNKISVGLADGWKESDQNKGAQNLLAGFESSDQRSSIFFTLAAANSQADMIDIMDGAVKNFETAFEVKKVSDYKTGQVQGPNKKWPAIYATMELEMKTNRDPIPFRFYVMIFDTGTELFMIQGSTMKPIRDVREKEILKMFKSVIAKN